MSAPRVMRYASRATARWTVRGRQNAQWKAYSRRPCIIQIAAIEGPRYFSTSIRNYAGLMPDSEDPQPPNRVEEHRMTQPTEIDEEEYHTHADQYMDAIHEKAEEMQEEREDVEVEYSVRFHKVQTACPKLTLNLGWRPFSNTPKRRYLHHQQATSKQTDLALIADVWTKAV